MDNNSIFWVNRWIEPKEGKHYEVICTINYSDDDGVRTMVELMEVLRSTTTKMADMLQKEMEKRGVTPVINDMTGEKILTEITHKLQMLSPSEAQQFIKDMHGILVKGK